MSGDKRVRSPQEKKAVSYERDRRNGYGENDKASRKAIPKRKALESRKDRHRVAQDLTVLPRLSEDAAAVVESSARHDVHRVGGWRKGADISLADHLSKRLHRRTQD
jgi:hypothetical protein